PVPRQPRRQGLRVPAEPERHDPARPAAAGAGADPRGIAHPLEGGAGLGVLLRRLRRPAEERFDDGHHRGARRPHLVRLRRRERLHLFRPRLLPRVAAGERLVLRSVHQGAGAGERMGEEGQDAGVRALAAAGLQPATDLGAAEALVGAAAALKAWLAAALLAQAACAFAQSFPAKPVRVVVAFSPGGVTDIIARTMGARLADLWSQAVVVEN